MSREQRAQQQAVGAFVASDIPTITEEAVRRAYHEDSDQYKCCGCGVAETKKKKHLMCSRCKTNRYCSKVCQRSHWTEHKGMCKVISSNAYGGSFPEDSKERVERFTELYKPMMQVATYFELKQSAKEMIMIFELEDLPAECKAPRIGIKSFRQESIRSQQDPVQEYHAECLTHAAPSDRTSFAMVIWPQANDKSIITMMPFAFDDSTVYVASGSFQAREDLIGILHEEASKYVKTINDMAIGGKKNLSKAAKLRRG